MKEKIKRFVENSGLDLYIDILEDEYVSLVDIDKEDEDYDDDDMYDTHEIEIAPSGICCTNHTLYSNEPGELTIPEIKLCLKIYDVLTQG